jgi:hypothetical protein
MGYGICVMIGLIGGRIKVYGISMEYTVVTQTRVLVGFFVFFDGAS